MPEETNALLELILFELADVKARQSATEEFLLNVYGEFSGIINAVNPTASMGGIVQSGFAEIYEQHRETCRAEMMEKIRQAKGDSIPCPDFIN